MSSSSCSISVSGFWLVLALVEKVGSFWRNRESNAVVLLLVLVYVCFWV